MDLLSKTAIARAMDPASSVQSAKRVTETVRATQQHQVLAAVRHTPGLTSAELAERYALERYMVARRLPELEPVNVVRGEMRRCTANGRRALTWWPV